MKFRKLFKKKLWQDLLINNLKRGVEVKKLTVCLLSIVLLLAFIVTGCDKNKEVDKDLDKVGEVNGEPITKAEYESHLSFLEYYYEIQTGTKLDENKDQAVINDLKTQTFDDLVLKKILFQQAEKDNIKITEKEIEEEVDRVKATHGEESYKKLLEDMGMNEEQLREQIETEKIYSALEKKVTADITVSKEETEKYYQENKDLFLDKGGMQISHILVDTEEKAKEILAKIDQGDDFANLAKEFSTCPSSAQGGDLGLINEDSNFVIEFQDAALKLKPGEITREPVKSEFGYHIIKAGTVKEARTIPFTEAEKELNTQLLGNKKAEAFYNYLQDLHEKAEIVDLREDKPDSDKE